ncbi:helix-turn-helix transcriptional regulator [Streptomyces sp. NBC_01275]|uniref:helix-turn-helix transcriptional regulator n=1 Tax=Streptomyces sp. NBC_01275 TaxID=2903807 RepID=UPI00224ECFEE|nr:helix-turn-helix transcriptional regulator [Streptomyces sp. NBC_01275]MCX4763718.1 helix-turn-helix transcriptional regulator [Streptomyces sp. NBC_01275]
MTPAPHTDHGVEELCAEGRRTYERALSEGRLALADADAVPCLLEFGLLHPSVDDPDLLEPVAPTVALHRHLVTAENRIAGERRREARLVDVFDPFIRLRERGTQVADTPAISLLSGYAPINLALTEAIADAAEEILAIQPRGEHPGALPRSHDQAMVRDQAFLDRGGRIRTLYQHTTRHAPTVLARYEQLRGDAEARSLDEVTERLIVIDRTVAFIPANADRTMALEVRHPALIDYFATTFDRLWRLATPMYPQAVQHPSLNGVTRRQHAIAALLVEGHTDAVIAARLGMNVRTARVHIAKLAATLGSDSRAQLGYLIGQSGILDQEHQDLREHRDDQARREPHDRLEPEG